MAEEFGGGVEDEGHQEKGEGTEEESAVVGGALGGFGEFDGDVGGEGAHAAEDVPVIGEGEETAAESGVAEEEATGGIDDWGIAGGHDDDHGFANGAAEADHEGGEDASGGDGEDDGADDLPAGGAEGFGGAGEGGRDIGESVFSDGEDDGDHSEAHHEADDEAVALIVGEAGELGPPEAEVCDLRAIGEFGDEEERFEGRAGEPGEVAEGGHEGGEEPELGTAGEAVALVEGDTNPDGSGEHGGEGDGQDEQQDGRDFGFDERGEPKGGEEAENDGREGGHDFHGGFDDAFDGGAEELAGVDGGEEGNRHGEEHGVEGAFDGADDEGDEGEFGFEVVGAAGGLPLPFGLAVAFVPNFAEEGAPASFGVGIVDGIEVERAVGVDDAEVLGFGVEAKAADGVGEIEDGADGAGGGVAEGALGFAGHDEGFVAAAGDEMADGGVEGFEALGFGEEAAVAAWGDVEAEDADVAFGVTEDEGDVAVEEVHDGDVGVDIGEGLDLLADFPA